MLPTRKARADATRNRAAILAAVYYTKHASRFWLAELTRRLAATASDIDAQYLAYAVFTALRADVIDHLLTVPGMTRERITTGIHNLATSHPA